MLIYITNFNMVLFKKKCGFCNKRIEKGKEFFKEVKDPVYTEKITKAFCCSGCAKHYEEKTQDNCCGNKDGGCCG